MKGAHIDDATRSDLFPNIADGGFGIPAKNDDASRCIMCLLDLADFVTELTGILGVCQHFRFFRTEFEAQHDRSAIALEASHYRAPWMK